MLEFSAASLHVKLFQNRNHLIIYLSSLWFMPLPF